MIGSPITFDRPALLFLIPLSLLAVWIVRLSSSRSSSRLQVNQTAFIRSLVVILICLAAAGVRWHERSSKLTTIYVVDVSDSISLDQRQSALQYINRSLRGLKQGDEAGLVVFGGEPSLQDPPASTLDTSQFEADVPGDSTNLESAIYAASGAMPSDSNKRIVLFTDGLENSGDARSTIPALQSQGIQVDIAPTMLVTSDRPEATVVRVVAPEHTSVSSPVPIRVVLSSNVPQNAGLTVRRDGTVIEQVNLSLQPGKSLVQLDDRLARAGMHHYVAELSPSADTMPENNVGTAAVLAEGSPQVLFLRDTNEPLNSALPDALRAQGLQVTELAPSDAPKKVAGFAGFDSVLLSDVAAGDLTGDQLTGLKSATRDFGVGLGMIGGLNSFGAGGYANTAIEDVLPVEMTPKKRANNPSADVVIVLDASGSMSAEEDGVEKVELAARAALNLLKALQPTDRVSVLAVTETAEIVMPLVSPTQAAKYIPAIEAVTAGGGGIDCRNGLEAAYTLLQTSNASIKHVIICPDTTDSEQQEGCVTLATEEHRAEGISTSVCGIGEWGDPDVPFQRSLAAAGHGQLYVANQAGNLPQFFQRDVQNVEQKLYDEGDFAVANIQSDPVGATPSHIPDLLGYNIVTSKHAATVPMTLGPHHDPLLAYWQYGIGKSFAFTSDDQSHWALPWVRWQEYAPTLAHIVRWSLKPRQDESFQTIVTNRDGTGHIVADAFNEAGFATNLHFQASVVGPDNSVENLPMSQTSPGRYETTFSTTSVGDYLAQITNVSTSGRQTASVSTSYSPEYADLQPNTDLLSELAQSTGGQFLSSPNQVFRRSRVSNLGSLSLVQPFLLLGAFLFLFDIAWRRFGWVLRREHAENASIILRDKGLEAVRIVRSRTALPGGAPKVSGTIKRRTVSDTDLLRRRTAENAHDADDDPFPYVRSLPLRKRKETESAVSKEKL